MEQAQRPYYIWLCSIEGVGTKRMQALCDYFGSPQAVFEHANLKQCLQVPWMGEATSRLLLAARNQARLDAANECLEKKGIRAYFQEDDGYPPPLRSVPDAPLVLFAKGACPPCFSRTAAIVGTRHCTRYGRNTAQKLSEELAAQGVTIVSGMARGIDASAHYGALQAGGFTVAVLGCGVDVIYPAEHGQLYEQICENGVVVSDYFPGTQPLPTNFPPRNRIISGMSDAVVIVESREKGGSMITYQFALEQGKEIFAVPGNIDSPASMGTNRMIRDGMFPVLEADDVLIRMRWGLQIHTNKSAPAWELTEDEQCVYEQLEQGDLSYDALAGYTGQSDAQLSTCLTLMEIRGIIKQLPGRIYTIVRS